jgi:hydrogenase maturation protease
MAANVPAADVAHGARPRVAEAARTLVIGYGSPIRGDDAIGPLAAEALAAGPLPVGVRVEARHILTAELAEDLAGVDRVVFLDAAVDGEPGAVRVRELVPDERTASTMAHFHDPRELLAWCATLYGRAPRAWLVTATGESFDYASYRLSPCAQEALARMLAGVRRLIASSPTRA